MRTKNKRGIAISSLALIILTVVGGITLMVYGTNLTKNTKKAGEMEQCRQSILYSATADSPRRGILFILFILSKN